MEKKPHRTRSESRNRRSKLTSEGDLTGVSNVPNHKFVRNMLEKPAEQEFKYFLVAVVSLITGLSLPMIVGEYQEVAAFVRFEERNYLFPSRLTTRTFATCAVVGTSGHLLGSSSGRTIDSFDGVFRVSTAPCVGYERDVGHKTTFRVLDYHTSTTALQETLKYSDGTKLLIYTPRHVKREMAINTLEKMLFNSESNTEIYLTEEDSVYLTEIDKLIKPAANTNQETKGQDASADLIALWAAEKLCDSVTTFGMFGEAYCEDKWVFNGVRKKYYQTLPFPGYCMSQYFHSQSNMKTNELQRRTISKLYAKKQITAKVPDIDLK